MFFEYNRMRFQQLLVLVLSILLLGTNAVGGDEASIKSTTCLECHEEMGETLRSTSHAVQEEDKDVGTAVMCMDCHSGAAVHVEDPDVDNIGNPSRLSSEALSRTCSQCHVAHVSLDNYGFDVHSELQVSCLSCHKVHGGKQGLLLSEKPDFCASCHETVAETFHRVSQHPLLESAVDCLDCHSFVKRSDASVEYSLDRTCESCHPEQAGPFPFEHLGTNGYLVEGFGCLSCHEAHSSQADRLLKQPAPALCQQCHIQPPGHLNLPALHGFIREIKDCTSCHTGMHGSFTSHKLLDPMLQTRLGSNQDCTQCHELTE